MDKSLIILIYSDQPTVACANLNRAGALIGANYKIETKDTQKFSQDEIDNADCILVLSDTAITDIRLDNKFLLQTNVLKGTHKAYELIKRALNGEGETYTLPVSPVVPEVNHFSLKKFFKKK